MTLTHPLIGACVAALVAGICAGAARCAEGEVNNGQDPTKPLTRLDLRY